VTGVLTDASLAFGIAAWPWTRGEVTLSGAGRGLSLTRRTARKLPGEVDVLEIDVTEPEQLAAAAESLAARWGHLDGLVHAIGFAPAACLGGDIMKAGWDDVATAIHISTYSFKALPRRSYRCCAPREAPRSSASTSTPRSHGRSTTGWAWRRPGSSPSAAISP